MQAFSLKFVLVGDSGCGKSQLSRIFQSKDYHPEIQSTVAMEFATRTIQFEKCTIKAQIWDTAGQERFAGMSRAYYRDCAGALLVYDITRKSSFKAMKTTWLKEIREHCGPIRIVLVGNKLDLVQSGDSPRQVSEDEGRQFAEQENIDFIETSAQSGYGVAKAFRRLTLSVAQHLPEVRVHLELNDLPSGWMAVIPEGETDMLPRNSEINVEDLDGLAGAGAGAGSQDSTDNENSGKIKASTSPESSAKSMSNFQSRLSVRKSLRSAPQQLPVKPKIKYKYMNYWTGEIFDHPPLYSADPGLLYTASLPSKSRSSHGGSGGTTEEICLVESRRSISSQRSGGSVVLSTDKTGVKTRCKCVIS